MKHSDFPRNTEISSVSGCFVWGKIRLYNSSFSIAWWSSALWTSRPKLYTVTSSLSDLHYVSVNRKQTLKKDAPFFRMFFFFSFLHNSKTRLRPQNTTIRKPDDHAHFFLHRCRLPYVMFLIITKREIGHTNTTIRKPDAHYDFKT